MSKQNHKLIIPCLLIFILAACSGQPTPPVGEAGGEGSVEGALVTYADASHGFSIGHPSTWTQDTSFANGVKFVGGDGSMSLELVVPSSQMDVMTYAKNDVAAVSAVFPGFNQLSLAASTEVDNAVVLGFTADDISTITGKPFTAHNERYYIGLPDGRIAVLTVVSHENNYDREGVRDIALTFKPNQ
jgi:hypothetical protein